MTPGAGATIATDEKNFGGSLQQVQYVALMDATNDSLNKHIVDSNGDAHVKVSGLRTSMNVGTLTVPVSAVATQVPATPLANRATLVLFNDSDTEMRVGGASVTTSGVTKGLKLPSGQSLSLDVGALPIYVVHAGAAGKDVNYMELA